jgi:hypothetical protein
MSEPLAALFQQFLKDRVASRPYAENKAVVRDCLKALTASHARDADAQFPGISKARVEAFVACATAG